MSGIQTESCSEGGLNVGWIDAGEWMDYAINPSAAGAYIVELRVAGYGGAVKLMSGSTVLATVTLPATDGYQTWTTVSCPVNLAAGEQTIRLDVDSAGWNLNWMRFNTTIPFPWDNGSGTGNWNTTDTNWSGRPWTNGPGNPAGFRAVGGTINLSAIVASDLVFGVAWTNIPNGSFNGGSLQANNLTVQGMYNNTGGPNPTLTLNVPAISVTGDIAVGRANLRIESGDVIANRLVTAAESPDYGTLALARGTLRLTHGLDSSTNGPVAFSMNLSGGALYTPSIRVGDWEQPNFGINVWSILDGTTIHPTANSSNFITFYGTGQNLFLGNHSSAASFSTDGFDITVGANLLASGTGGLSKQGAGTLTLSGRNTYSGTTAVQGGVLALASQTALGEGPLSISAGAKAALNFSGQSYVTQLMLGGSVQAAGTYGSSSSPATNKNDTWFSGPGVIQVSATIDHVAMATSNLSAADTAWAASDWATVRSALSNVFNDLKLTAQWRSIAHLRYARSFQAAGDYAAASTVFAVIAETTEYPLLHKLEGSECKTECDRLALGLPGRDPVASRVAVPPALPAARTYHVSASGSDGNSGTLGQPFATVNRALEANRAAGPVAAGEEVLIQLASGRYELANTISLGSADSANGPLRIKAATPGGAIISGGKPISGFTMVTDPSVLARLPEEALGKVMQCSLSALGITDYGSVPGAGVNLYANGVPQTLARWPNSGFVPIAAVTDGGNRDYSNPSLDRPQTFTYNGSRPSRWTTAPDGWLAGYFWNSNSFDQVAIGSINPQAGTITTATCVSTFTGWPEMSGGAPFRAFNLLEEIDQPGEWYLDRASGILYWYPAVDPGTAAVEISVLTAPMLTANNVSNLRVEGVVFEASRGAGLQLNGCSNALVTGCTVRNMRGVGVLLNGGAQNSMIGCDLSGLEQDACQLFAGDRHTLAPGSTVVANCRFSNLAAKGIYLIGVGNRVTHCKFEDTPNCTIVFHGQNNLVEYNEFRNCCNEADDTGVIGSWGNPTYRGNIWRFNHFTHCGGGYTQGWVTGRRYFGTNVFRFDDAVSGQNVYGNIVDHHDVWGQMSGAIGNNSGRDNIIDNNLILDANSAYAGYYAANNRMFRWWEVWQDPPNGLTPVYLAAFPELNRLFDGKGQNFIWRSLSLRCVRDGLPAFADSADWRAWQFIANTNTNSDPGFIEGSELKTNIDQTLFWNLGMRAIPVNEIGLYDDAARAGWLDKTDNGYWNGGAGTWDNASVNWSANTGVPASGAWMPNQTAVFAGSGGAVTVAAPVTVDGLSFATSGYTLEGTNPVELHNSVTMIDQKSHGATINAPLTGLGGIAVAGAGTLTLGGSSSYNGTTAIRVGTLRLAGGDNRLPKGTVLTLGDSGSANVGTLKLDGRNQELAGLWTVGFEGGNAGNRVINGSATPCTLTLNIEHGINDQFAGTLGGPGQYDNNFALTITGGGTLSYPRSVSWTGGTLIEKGTLLLTSSLWQGNQASGTFRIGQGGTLAVSGAIDILSFNGVTVEFLAGGGGNLANFGGQDWLSWQANGMTIRSTGGQRNLFYAAPTYILILNENALFDITRGSDPTSDMLVSIPLEGNGGIIKQGNGIMTLSGSNGYSGTTTIAGGMLNAASFSNYGVSGSLGNRASDSGPGNVGILFRGGTLQYTGSTPQSTNRAIRISTAGGATIDASGSNPAATLSFTAATSPDFFENPGNRTLTLTGSNTGDNTFAMAITEVGVTSLVKSGSGKWILTGANNYTGSTTVSGGILSLTSASLGDNSSVIVEAGAMLHLDFAVSDQIGGLWVDGLQLPPGVYSSTSGFITGSGTLTVTTGPASADYTTWSGRGIHNLAGGPADDDDDDSVANLLEYVLGGNPRATSSGILPTASASAGNLVFTFRRIQATTADTTQIFQHGTNLSGWADVPIVADSMVAIQPDTPQAGTDTVTITVPEGIAPRIFGRLKVSAQP